MTRARRRWPRPTSAVTAAVLALGIAGGSGAAPADAELSGQYWFQKLSIDKAWTVSRGAGVTVAVVDSGVVGTLGDLRGQVLPGKDFSGLGTDARVDKGSGCDEPGGCFSHGTLMALDIAGTGKGTGFQGVAPEAKILPVKVSTRDGADFPQSAVADGIRWAVDHGADVVNVSIGGIGGCDPDEAAAAKYAYQHDVIVVASTGNTGGAVLSPANCPGTIAVGAIDAGFRPWNLSNSGPDVDFVAAGVNTVQETLNGTELNGGNGTSDAAAIVAGTFALIRSHTPEATAREVIQHATNNVHNGTGRFGVRVNDKLGYGEVLPYFAMTYQLKANAPNPIYDGWERELGPPTPTAPGSSAAGSTASKGSTSIPPSGNPDGGPTNGAITVGGSDSSSDSSTGLIIGIAAAVLVLAAIAGYLIARSRGRATHS